MHAEAAPARRRALLWLLTLALAANACRADTVASLLGNFTINQYCGLTLVGDAVQMHYAVVFGQLPALRELHVADADGNGVTSQAERDAYVARLAPALAGGLKLVVDGRPVALRALRFASSLPTEQGGFSLRVDVDLAAALPVAGDSAPGTARTLRLDNQNYAGRMGWHEITVQAAPGLSVYDTDAHADSLTGGLTEALQALPAAGPLDERNVHLSFRQGGLPAGAAPLSDRSGRRAGPFERSAAQVRAAPLAAGAASAGDAIAGATRRLVDAISAPHIAPGVALAALLGALLLGAVHALSPGHGKSVVGAYLIGSRGTPRHAVFLGLTVTITHTVGVFVLGFATLYASRFIVPERLFPVLSAISAAMIFGMGLSLLIQRARTLGRGASRNEGATVFRRLEPREARQMMRLPMAFSPPSLHALAGGAHDPGNGMHSHGGRMHSHLPPGAGGEPISWRSLLTLGISGGLVPCPSALVLLLAAVALNKTAYGMLLVLAFSAGLALTLIAVGLVFLYARNRLPRAAGARWEQLLPLLSAVAITLVGLVLCAAAYRSFSPGSGTLGLLGFRQGRGVPTGAYAPIAEHQRRQRYA